VKTIAIVQLEDKFYVSDKGIIIIGKIVEGDIEIGNYIEFKCNNEVLKRKIILIDSFYPSLSDRHPSKNNMNLGMLIECLDKDEETKVNESELVREKTIVYKR
jgi:translation elongation factor EF-Tu-like GTPase